MDNWKEGNEQGIKITHYTTVSTLMAAGNNVLMHEAEVYLSLSLSFPVAPTLEHRASVRSFVTLQFLNPSTVVGILGRGISPSQGRYLTQT
jgi:hypothetical protein